MALHIQLGSKRNVNNKTIIFTVGVSGSGKSTWARKQYLKDPTVRIVERDQIRFTMKHLLNYDKDPSWDTNKWNWKFWNWKLEDRVQELWKESIETLLKNDLVETIIVSDTNLNQTYLQKNIDWLKELAPDVKVRFRYFPIEFYDAVNNDRMRGNYSVGYSTIARQIESWNRMNLQEHQKDHGNNPNAIIVDIDGTLAINNSGRSFYDYSKVNLDTPREILKNIINGLFNDYTILIVSGRDEESRESTIEWLINHEIWYHHLFMRDHKDTRKDTIIKSEIYLNEILPSWSVKTVFDDRPSVCRMWRAFGLDVMQLGNPYLEF